MEDQHLEQFQLGFRHNLVLKVESRERHQRNQHNEGAKGSDKRDACCFDGKKFQTLSQIAERDEACQQNRQRQCHWHQCQSCIEEELHIHINCQSLTDEVIDVLPQKLHHNDKQADAEGACKQREEILQNEGVKSLDESHFLPRNQQYTIFQGAKVGKNEHNTKHNTK